MAKVLVPSSSCAGVDVDGRRYVASKGVMDVPDHLVARLKRNGECFTPSGAAFAADGFICESCGFHAVLKTCGRCGARCHRPGEKTND